MKKIVIICTSLLLVVALVICGIIGYNLYCEKKTSEQRAEKIEFLKIKFQNSFDSYNEKEVVKILTDVKDNYKSEFDDFVLIFEKQTKETIKVRDKNNADFLIKLNSRIQNSNDSDFRKISKNLMNLIENSFENILLSNLKGKWIRQDSSDLSGTIINVNVNSDFPAATIVDVSGALNNANFFKIGDVKWNNIHCIDSSVFVFTDMWKTGEFETTYHQARGLYNYDTDSIDVMVDVSDGNGIAQHLVRYTK